ncbi:major facilitator superfamily domain-containing protein, partial [Lobosporangium transversale]
LLDIINIGSVVIILPDIMHQVGFRADQLQWVSSAYALAFGALLLVGGRLGDLFGHRRMYILGITWFSIWSLVNGFAKNPIVMSVGRALQGVGAGFTIPNALAILTTTYPAGPERNQALAVFGGSGAVGSVLGVLLGGLLGSTIGWRWIFYFTAILGFIMAALAIVIVPKERDISTVEDRRIDIMGSFLFTLGIVAVIYYLSEGPNAGWASALALVPFCVGLVFLLGFLVVEWKIKFPIMPLHIWHSRRLVASTLAIMSQTAATNAMVFFFSLTAQNVQSYSPMTTSLCFIANGLGSLLCMAIMTKLVTKVRTKIISVFGSICSIASFVLLAQIKEDSSYWSIAFPALILNALGMAPIWLCCQINSVADARNEDQGVVGASK